VKLGVYIFATDETIAPAELARAAEERGFESFFLPEHTHIPAGRETPWPGGGELPRRYYRTLDPFVALAAAATATESLLVGTGVCLVIERDPIVLAKEVATIDHVSDGRFLFGIGAGWNREEMANHGTDPRTRFALLRERILAMKAIWAEERAEFHGEHVDFDPINLWPKPLQRPHPPILVGGKGAGVIERVLDYGDGWFPNPRDGDPALVEEQIVELGRRAAERGRPAVPVSIFGASPRPEDLERYSELGVERCVLSLPTAPREEVLAALDRAAELIPAFGS
jgi:probable F420-dependent oxidoreductase